MSIPNSLKTQVGGLHYSKYEIQPLSFAEYLQLTPIIFCIFKYLVRYKDKNGLEDLKKALHCVDVFVECGYKEPVMVGANDLSEFLAQFDKKQANAIFKVLCLQSDKSHADKVRELIKELMLEYGDE